MASARGDERPLFKGHERAEFPNEFPAASAAINERPMERHEPSKAAIYKTATRAEFPSGEAATG